MQRIKIDLLKAKYHLDEHERKSSVFFVYAFLILFILLAVSGTVFSYQVHSSSEGKGFHFSLFSTVQSFIQAGDKAVQGEKEDRVNILLLGVGGNGHDGPELSDTIMLASLRPSDQKVGLLSIPRDLTVEIPDYGWGKINHINAFGENKERGYGPVFAGEVIGTVLDQEIQYYVKIDFSGFAKLIDDIGGVDIFVDQPFIDTQYPTEDYLYQTVSFAYGSQHMDGKIALMYVRSRHGNNGQGSDFARSRRQQQVMTAVKEKILSASTLLNPLRINRILETLENHLFTNLNTWELLRLSNLMGDPSALDINHHVLDVSEGSPLYATTFNGVYVILPKNDDWGPIQALAESLFDEATERKETYSSSNDVLKTANKKTEPVSTPIRLEIQNGTTTTGLASRIATMLEEQGFEIVEINNAEEQTYTKTIIYDFTGGTYEKELLLLQDYFHAEIQNSSSEWMTESLEENITDSTDVDFLLILGTDNETSITPVP